jgi:hypothetical protein
VSCLYRAKTCRGTVTLRSGRRLLGRTRVDIPWGSTAIVAVPLRRSARRLAKRRDVRARALLAVRDGAAPRTAAVLRLSQRLTLP